MLNDLPAAAAKPAAPHAPSVAESLPRPTLGLSAAIALIVGVVIGAGIFKAPSLVAGMAGSTEWMFAAWILGGLISLIGALCYAELTTAYSHAGGDYHFLFRAYGRSVAFLFGWARFSVITTGSIALLGFVVGDYMNQILPLTFAGKAWGSVIYAAITIIGLTWVNLFGIRAGSLAQTWLTVMEAGGLLMIVVAAALLIDDAPQAAAAANAPATMPPLAATFGLAMVFVLLTYGGWNEAAYISAEVKDNSRNMVKALTISILIITVLYVLVTWAYWKGLGFAGMAKSDAIAADLMRIALGPIGESVIAVLVSVSAITSINATIIVGARTSYAVARDWPILGKLGEWDGKSDTPANAMRVQCIAALALLIVGGATGSGFKAMVEFTAPIFWLFFLLAGFSLVVLRIREPHARRPFKVPLYPVLPLLFCAVCGYMLWSSLSYVYSQELGGLNAAWIGVAVLFIGIGLMLLMRVFPAKQKQSDISFETR
ncbi:MAG: amino acid permease [Noviherbaspirillum sp.]|nr:amino acid permease [Noviherbaspirillum sp.]